MAQFTAQQFQTAIQEEEALLESRAKDIEEIKERLKNEIEIHEQKMAGAREAGDKPQMTQIRADIKQDREDARLDIEEAKEEARRDKQEIRRLKLEMRNARKRGLL